MRRRTVTRLLCLGLAASILLVVMPSFGGFSFSLESQRKWISDAMSELAKAEPPSSSTNRSLYGIPWILPGYLIFSNGWAAYEIHTFHDGVDIGDVALLRTSDGNYYLSHLHFCVGIVEDMPIFQSTNESRSQPADAKDFFEHFGNRQEWNLMTKDNRLWCVINFPSEPSDEHGKKEFWVWIVDNEGTNQVTLFDKPYVVTGNYVSWNTHWLTNGSLAIIVYDHGRVSSELPQVGRSYLITSLIYYRDKQTGKFTEKR